MARGPAAGEVTAIRAAGVTLAEAAEAFLSSPRAASPSTCRAYAGVIDRLAAEFLLALAEVTPARAAAVNRELVGAGLAVREVREVRRPLREVFLDLTGRRTGGTDAARTRARRPCRRG